MISVPASIALDAYKLGHADQYPEGTEYVYSNMTPRSLKHFHVPETFKNNKIVAFGMWNAVHEIVDGFDIFFQQDWEYYIKPNFIKYTKDFAQPTEKALARLKALHTLGYLPLEFKALDEGSIIEPQIPVLTVINTHPDFFWLTNRIETWLSTVLWKPMTAATIAFNYRLVLEHYANKTRTDLDFVDFQAHDFSPRGMSGLEDAARTGMGHLTSFKGSDNVPSAWYIDQVYDCEGELVGASVPATEHAVMCAGGKEDEIETIRRLIEDIYPSGIASIVSDSWDFWRVITDFALQLKGKILARDGKTVFRPDSCLTTPADILCGTAIPLCPERGEYLWEQEAGKTYVTQGKYYRLTGVHYDIGAFNPETSIEEITDPTPEMKGAVQCLWEIFGGTTTSTGHKLLDQHVGLIYGDSITMELADEILDRLEKKGFASGNVVLGIGSFTYQYVTRDTLGTAIKATLAVVNGEERELFKDPKTDPGKKSARGWLMVEQTDDGYVLHDHVTKGFAESGALKTIFKNGQWTQPTPKLSDIRAKILEEVRK